MRKRVAIIIPAYNEATVIHKVLDGLQDAAKGRPFDIEVIVINDRSTDLTSITARKSGVVVIDHIINTGAGGATATGLSYAKENSFDIAASMDADGQHDPEDVLDGIDRLTNNSIDLMIGSRLINTTGMSRTKIIGNKGLSLITRIMFGVNASDSQSGLRIFSRKAIERIYWKTDGYEFCSEMIWRAKQAGLSIGEFPIKAIYSDYSRSKGQNNWNAINIVKSLIKQRVEEVFE